MSERLSLLVSHILDKLGYNEEMRQYRIDKYSDMNYVLALSSKGLLLGGSKAEGASKYSESDFDFLIVLEAMKATERTDILEGDKVTLHMDYATAPPGYCKLRLLQCVEDNIYHRVFSREDCYVQYPGYDSPHLSSTFVLNVLHGTLQKFIPCQVGGPASKLQHIDGCNDTDAVFAIRCDHTPNALKQWLRRQKGHAWPAKVTAQIAQSDIFLVPAGKHGSHYQYLEWRISFNEAEKILITNFTVVQYQVYILMKKIMKEVIQPQCPESITSYIIKTLMLWVVEGIPRESWRKDKLIDAVLYVLEILHICVQQNVCPMYFIPEDNILEGRLKEETRRDVFYIVSTLLKCGVSCVLQVPSLANPIYRFMEMGVPLHDVLVDQQLEKVNILVNNIEMMHETATTINNTIHFLCCREGHIVKGYKDLLTEIARRSLSPHTRRLLEHIFNETLSQFSLKKFSESVDIASNIHKYPSVRQTLTLLYQKHRDDVLSGKLRLAQVLYALGHYREAQNVLEEYVKKDYLFRKKSPYFLRKDACHLRLQYVLGNECLSTRGMMRKFVLGEIKFDKQMEDALPCALKYELYKPDEVTDVAQIDPEPLLYYLQYICSTQLRQRRKTESALAHLTWYATRIDSNIEYREVALNVLAHCMLKKGLYNLAAKLLTRSIMLYKQHRRSMSAYKLRANAAVWQIAVLLNKIRNNR